MYLTLFGTPITKKNSMQIVMAGRHPKLLPSKQYRQYAKDCSIQIRASKRQRIDYPVNVRCVYYMPTKRRVDLVNLIEATMDILVDNEVLEDDNCKIVAMHDGSCVQYDKENPRVEVTIDPILGLF